ncbi:MarR family winged helix-turn-helix transcriptional regulator [Nocardioides limicola]|uniref:MarR family winged helix-turn-helix transcriptional regulator n=1 Tax=Nocardioides limicola TaxID=2803368 RepID=UPI0027DAF3D5|nr:MarR family transcriptional regulator [Nocardioides sp. DJM-14]
MVRVEDVGDLAGKVMGVSEQLRADFDTVAGQHGLTDLQARTLLTLAEPQSMSEVAGAMTCGPSNVTGLADRLERLGLIVRVPDPRDRRVTLLELTDEGRRRRERLAEALVEGSMLVARLTPSERGQLKGLLDKLLG